MKPGKAAGIVREGCVETLTYYTFPSEHWHSIRTNNPLERILREVRRRTRVVGNFPDGHPDGGGGAAAAHRGHQVGHAEAPDGGTPEEKESGAGGATAPG